MTNSIRSAPGKVNKAGADDALFLKQFGGEILTEFETNCIFKPRTYVRTIKGGKSAQFPLIGTVQSSLHTPGNFIDGQEVGHAEQTIYVDGLMVAPIFVASIDEMENHYDIRGPYATEMGRELAYQYDKNVARMYVKAARATSALTGRSGGSIISGAGMNTNSDTMVAALFSAAQAFDEKNVSSDLFGYFRPAQWYLLAQNTKLLDSDYKGSANISTGEVDTAAGIKLVKSNHVPNYDANAGNYIAVGNKDFVQTKYRADYSKTVAVIGNKWAVGTVQLADISMESDWESRRQGTFMVAKMAVGHDVLRPDGAIELALP